MRTVFNISGLWLCLLAALPARAQVRDTLSPAAPLQELTIMQDTSYIVVRDIIVAGNKRTRRSVILREFGIKPGDTIRLRNLAATLEINRKQLLNTSLFLNVLTNVKDWNGNEANVVIDVLERWYLLAFPVFKLADRNFNQWWVEQKKSLRRVNIGVKAWQDNLTGRNDELYADVSFGYTQKFVLGYTLPYIDRKLRHGIGFSAAFSRNREINYISADNKQQFFRQDDFLRRQMAFGVSYTYRKAISTRHQAFLTYHNERVADSVAKLNPDYLGGGRTEVKYAEILYRLDYIKADSWQYPLIGQSFRGEISKAGLGFLNDIDYLKIRLKGAKYWQYAPKTYGAVSLLGQVKFPNDLPYAASRAMGYSDDYLRGLEYYVVDGTAFFILKNTLRRELLNFKVRLPVVPKKFSNLPIRVLAKAYGDVGYGYSKLGLSGVLSNRMLYTAGLGLDIVSFYDTCIRFEYSINQMGEKGLFLHAKLDM